MGKLAYVHKGKLKNFKFVVHDSRSEVRKFWIEDQGIPEDEVDEYIRKVAQKLKNIPYEQDVDPKFFSRFNILGCDTEIYIPDRSR